MDKSHFNTFIFSNSDKIYHYVYCLVKDQEEALDVVTLTIEECWEKRKIFSHTDMIFVFKIARKLAKLRVAKRKSKEFSDYANNLADANPVLARFCSLTRDLSPLQAEVMCLRAMVRLSMDDISIVVEQGINNVQSILAVVRKAIRARINPTNVVADLKTNEVLFKYYSGKSSLKDEEQLRLYFSRMDLSDATGADRELFQLFIKVGNAPMPTVCSDYLLQKIKEIQERNWWSSLLNIFG
ncbi:RNA polymerase sigma factor [Labilibaculum sp.]|uniref:RNA polymerase sigma factor n=1 Tax=Labilibaculum sp. TaxID=2060723 RepID=UPI00356162A2